MSIRDSYLLFTCQGITAAFAVATIMGDAEIPDRVLAVILLRDQMVERKPVPVIRMADVRQVRKSVTTEDALTLLGVIQHRGADDLRKTHSSNLLHRFMPYRDPIRQKEAQRTHYLSNKHDYKERNTERRSLRRKWFYALKSRLACIRCTETSISCLDFHHPGEKTDEVSNLVFNFRSMKRVIEEIERCVTLCSNCHRKVHAGETSDEFASDEFVRVPVEFRHTDESALKDWSAVSDSNRSI